MGRDLTHRIKLETTLYSFIISPLENVGKPRTFDWSKSVCLLLLINQGVIIPSNKGYTA